jgi:hypothetical protein
LEVSGQLHVPADLLPGKEPTVTVGWEAGWVLEAFWMTRRGEKYYFYLDSNSDASVVQPVAISDPISQLYKSTYDKPIIST